MPPPPSQTKPVSSAYFPLNWARAPPLMLGKGGTVAAQRQKKHFWGSYIFRAPPATGLVTALLNFRLKVYL